MRSRIYFDNAATSFPKPRSVVSEVKKCISEYCANPGRSTHRLAIEAAERVFETRELVSELINTHAPEHIAFTLNATHALNAAIKGCIDHKCHVITSDLEHNSVIRPLNALKNSIGIDISVFDSDLPLDDAISGVVRGDTEFIVTTLASNVTGKVFDPTELSRVAKKHSLFVIADASQYLGHLSLDMVKAPLDIVCAPSHKGLLGIPGGGFISVLSKSQIRTILEGGSGGDTFNTEMPPRLPERLEAGTISLPAIVGLGAGIKYLNQMGAEYIEERISSLSLRLLDVLESCGAHIYGCANGIASFEFDGYGSAEVAMYLDDAGIAVRDGLHCAPGTHRKLGTASRGLVRASLSIFNTKRQIDRLYHILKQM